MVKYQPLNGWGERIFCSPAASLPCFAGIAQSVEQLIRNQQVVSSSLISSSKKEDIHRDVLFFDFAEGAALAGCLVQRGKIRRKTEKYSRFLSRDPLYYTQKSNRGGADKMINLLVAGAEGTWERSPAFFRRERCLTEYILPQWKAAYAGLDGGAVAQLKQYPCLFLYERGHRRAGKLGTITDIQVQQTNVRIDFTCSGREIAWDTLDQLAGLLDMGAWEWNRTHWTVKQVSCSDLEPYITRSRRQPKVFLSYSWTPASNQEAVFDLAARLRRDGIAVVYDRDDLHPGQNINYFMEQSLLADEIDNIIVVCNKDYAEKANARAGGVGYESGIILSEIRGKPMQERVIPVGIETDERGRPYLPTAFRELCYIDLTGETGYGELKAAILRCWERNLAVKAVSGEQAPL